MSSSSNIPPKQGPVYLRLVGTDADDEAPSTITTPAPPQPEENARRLAHELTNLLDGSMRNVGLALARLGDVHIGQDDVVDETTERLRTAGDAMRRMAQLLRRWMSGTDEDVARLFWQDATLGDAVRYAALMLEAVCETRGITLDLLIPADLAVTPAGPMYPVIANAMRNAVEAIERGGTVAVRGWLIGDEAKLEVTDDGPGIAPFLPRDADGLVSPGATTKADGHGLGLAISRQIVASFGGTLQLRNHDSGGAVLSIQWNTRRLSGEPTP